MEFQVFVIAQSANILSIETSGMPQIL
jgi:hypothetical protein